LGIIFFRGNNKLLSICLHLSYRLSKPLSYLAALCHLNWLLLSLVGAGEGNK
jgi:hypothetical protein